MVTVDSIVDTKNPSFDRNVINVFEDIWPHWAEGQLEGTRKQQSHVGPGQNPYLEHWIPVKTSAVYWAFLSCQQRPDLHTKLRLFRTDLQQSGMLSGLNPLFPVPSELYFLNPLHFRILYTT
jgi:hypothetical protein